MKQLTQVLGTGEMLIQEVPSPIIDRGMIKIRTYFSIISAGTEKSTVGTARKNLLAKAKARPDQVKQVIKSLKNQGPIQTYRAVSKRLDAYSPLGYSCSGRIIEIGDDVESQGYNIANTISTPMLVNDWKKPHLTMLLIVGPEKPIDETEAQAIYDFVTKTFTF